MAEFDLKIATMRLDAEYTQTPVPEDESWVLDVLYSESDAEISTSSGSFVYRWMLDGSLFKPNSWYAVWAQGAFGGFDGITDCILDVVLGPESGTVTVYGHAVARGYATPAEFPAAQRAGNMSCVFLLQNPDQEDLGFRYQSNRQLPIYIDGLSLMAMELDPAKITQNEDWFHSQFNSEDSVLETKSVGTSYDVYSADFNITEPGDYMLWSGCEVSSTNPSGPEDRWLNTFLNGSPVDANWWYKYNKSSGDFHNPMMMQRISLSVGVNTIKIMGKAQAGPGTRKYYRPAIFILRLGKFSNYNYGDSVITSWTDLPDVHPSFGLVKTATLDIPASDTNVMVWGGAQMRRSSNGGKIMRLRLDGVPRGDFMCDANTTGSITGDEPYVYTFGMKVANLPVVARLEAANGSAPLGTYPTGYTALQYERLFMLSTAIEAGPLASFSKTVVDGIGVVEGITPKNYSEGDGVGVGEVVTHSITGSGSNRPKTSYPRMWIGNSGFLAGLKAAKLANSAEWQSFESHLGYSSHGSSYNKAWWWALDFVMTGSGTSKANALAELQISLDKPLSVSMSDSTRLWNQWCRNIALSYDWLKTYAPDDITATMDEQVHNWMMCTSYLRFTARTNPLAEQIIGDSNAEWASNNPANNFYYGSMLAMSYVAGTLEGSDYLSGFATRLRTGTKASGFEWPFNDGSNTGGYMTWEIPFDDWDHSQGFYGDPWEFVIDRLELMTFPEMDIRALGGDWPEGWNYGRAAWANHSESMNVIKYLSGLDYAKDPAHPVSAGIPLAHIYAGQPGDSRVFHTGDVGSQLPLTINNYNRRVMLLVTNAQQGRIEGQYAQWWLDNVLTEMNSSVPHLVPWDFFMYRSSYLSNNYTLSRNPWYVASGTGFVNSRTNWLDDNTAISFSQIAQDVNEDHQHHDQGGIQLWIGGQSGGSGLSGDSGWLLVDRKVTTGAAREWETESHNCVVFEETSGIHSENKLIGQRYSYTDAPAVGVLSKNEHISRYTYTQVNTDIAYRIELSAVSTGAPKTPNSASFGDDNITTRCQRETMFLRSVGPFLVVYDRAEMDSFVGFSNPWFSGNDYHGFPMHQMWHFLGPKPTSVGGDSYRYQDATDKRMFMKFYGHDSIVWEDKSLSSTFGDCWAAHVIDQGVQANKDLITVFEPTTTATATATASTIVDNGDEVYGVCIEDSSEYQAVLFSRNRDATFAEFDGLGVPQSIAYTTPRGSSNWHTFCNLTPGRRYDISVVEQFDSLDVLITTNFATSGPQLATAAGIIEFNPLDLSEASDFSYTVTDTIGTSDPKQPMGIGYTVTDNVGSGEDEAYGLGGAGLYTDIDNVGVAEDIVPSYGIPVRDKVRLLDEATYSKTGTTPVHKRIDTLVTRMVPNLIQQGGWFGNPSDAILHTKVDNGVDTYNDDEYIVAEGLVAISNAVIIHFPALTPSITAQRIRFRVRTREIEHFASPTLTLQAELYDTNSSLIDVQTFSLATGYNYTTVNFPWIDYVNKVVDNMYVIMRAVSPSWDAETRVEISEIEVEIHYKGLEKRIGDPR